MILPDHRIKKLILDGIIQVSPAPDFEAQLGPCSLDLKLGNFIKIFKSNLESKPLDLKNIKNIEDLMEKILIAEGESFVLKPNSFALAITKENFSLPANILARLEGRSSLARLGIIVHSTAARLDLILAGMAKLF
ncbi:MAG: dCTP deaminase [bacterium]|nr:dCTP deaminase [bacterium]